MCPWARRRDLAASSTRCRAIANNSAGVRHQRACGHATPRTNYDLLFEGACSLEQTRASVFFDELESSLLPSRAILKLHGSIAEPRSLLLTENELYSMDRSRRRFWEAALELLRTRFVVALGSSLRDPSVPRLLCEAGAAVRGVHVVPQVWPSTAKRVAAMGLLCIASDADAFLEQLAAPAA
jgi:SIR2-like protein